LLLQPLGIPVELLFPRPDEQLVHDIFI